MAAAWKKERKKERNGAPAWLGVALQSGRWH
jgi:hypothetical protein